MILILRILRNKSTRIWLLHNSYPRPLTRHISTAWSWPPRRSPNNYRSSSSCFLRGRNSFLSPALPGLKSRCHPRTTKPGRLFYTSTRRVLWSVLWNLWNRPLIHTYCCWGRKNKSFYKLIKPILTMPHLSPINWPFLLFFFWLILLLIKTSLWWIQLPIFPSPSTKTLSTPFTPWNWS